jgi:hypothetical protein
VISFFFSNINNSINTVRAHKAERGISTVMKWELAFHKGDVIRKREPMAEYNLDFVRMKHIP